MIFIFDYIKIDNIFLIYDIFLYILKFDLIFLIIKGSLDEKFPSYEVLKMLRE